MSVRIQIRRDTAANWTSENPILAQGEMGFETDTEQLKFGNGTDTWDDIDYFIDGSVLPIYELITATGTDTYAAAYTPVQTLTNGLTVRIKFTNANSGASTFNLQSTGAVTLRKADGTALSSGDIAAGSVWWVIYDGTASQWRLLGGSGSGAGGGVWGSITGNLPDQSDIWNAIGLLEVTPVTVDTTLDLTHQSRTIPVNAAVTRTITVPANATIAFPINTVIGIKWETGAVGQPAVAAAVGVTINDTSGDLLVPTDTTVAYLKKIGTNEWDFYNGTGSSGGSGDVTGPASSTDTEVVIYSGATGKIIKNSSKVLTTVGGNILALTNPSAISYLRINADNTVTALTANQLREGLNIPITVILPGDVINNNGTPDTLADVTGLTFTPTNGGIYHVYVFIVYSTAAGTTGSRWTLNGGTNTALVYNTINTVTTTTQTLAISRTVFQSPAAANAGAPNTDFNIAEINGLIRSTSTTPVQVQFASEIGGSAVTALGGLCFLRYTKLN